MDKKPWAIKYRYVLLGVGISLFIYLSIFFKVTPFHSPLSGVLAISTAILAFCVGLILTIGIFPAARKFDEILNALAHEVVRAKMKMSFIHGKLACETVKYGKFSIVYRQGVRHGPSFYELFIPITKSLPPDEEDILTSKLPYGRLKKIKSLYYVGADKKGLENRWVAKFDDKWFYSETSDIIKCLKILREVEGRLQ